ncbi:MAG TPA: S41 family peptidase, partial [Planctomycetota bacterium]|nr:S41 family peptidase [Planctomycetota bacterium]
MGWLRSWCVLIFAFAALLGGRASAQSVYEKDLDFALDALETDCGALLVAKHIDWKAVRKEFAGSAKPVTSDQAHLVLLTRLLARIQDGHCHVVTTDKTKDVKWPDEPERVGCGMFWCRSGKKILLKTVWGTAAADGLSAGFEVVKVNDKPVDAWLDARIKEMRDLQSFSTEQQAFYRATHQGLAMPAGTRLELELKDPGGKEKKKRTITYAKGSAVPFGPAVMPEGLEGGDDVSFKLLDPSVGYIRIRRCKETLPSDIDSAFAKVGSAKGLILDFRANSGGGFDHPDFMGRFVPKGEKLQGGVSYESRGEHPFGGPIVVIVDAGVVSAGETASGIFKEDGRGYMIGETATAGMSSQKK